MRRAVRKGWDVAQRRVGAGLSWLFPKFGPQDLHLWAYVAMFAYGLEQVYHPLVWIVPGGLFTFLAWPKRPMIPVKLRKDS